MEGTPSGAHSIAGASTSVTAFVGFTPYGPVDAPVHIFSFADFEQALGKSAADCPLGRAVRLYFLNGGSEAYVVSVANNAGALLGRESDKSGVYQLEKVDSFNLLVMPDRAADETILPEVITYCARRRAFMILDVPDTVKGVAAAQQWIETSGAALRSINAAIYFPRLTVPGSDPSGPLETVAAAGALAGLYARTDVAHGVWAAPAGVTATIDGVTGLEISLKDNESEALNGLAINCLRAFPVYGLVSWGARTARGTDELGDDYKYVPVRRLALFIEDSVYRDTQWAALEPNDEALWSQLRLDVNTFMEALNLRGAFRGPPGGAYFVQCDASTTSVEDMENGRVNIVIGFAPEHPAEFVVIQIQLSAGPTSS